MKSHRHMCYRCNRPQKLCLCQAIVPIQTKTTFVILIHPKEFKRIKNNTGRLTHLSLKNSHLFCGVDFTHHKALNSLLNAPDTLSFILFPSNESQPLETLPPPPKNKRLLIILIDATWSSAKPILRLSKNLHPLPKLSFSHTKTSAYHFKRQPFKEALSTIESTCEVLRILNEKEIEALSSQQLLHFLDPFYKMIDFQLKFNS